MKLFKIDANTYTNLDHVISIRKGSDKEWGRDWVGLKTIYYIIFECIDGFTFRKEFLTEQELDNALKEIEK